MRNHRPESLLDAVVVLARDERGTAMLEFVLISPILCYMIVAILFFRNHLDYAQDSTFRARENEWAFALPDDHRARLNPAPQALTQENSDDRNFIRALPLWVREAVMASGLLGADVSSGGVLAADRFFNTTGGTPYDRLSLPRNNYRTSHVNAVPIVEEPWAGILSGLGTFFGERVGGGSVVNYEGLRVTGWTDKFPELSSTWKNPSSQAYPDGLDPCSNPVIGAVMNALNVMTLFRTPIPRIDTRQSVDIGRDTPSFLFPLGDTCSRLQLTRISNHNQIKDAIQ